MERGATQGLAEEYPTEAVGGGEEQGGRRRRRRWGMGTGSEVDTLGMSGGEWRRVGKGSGRETAEGGDDHALGGGEGGGGVAATVEEGDAGRRHPCASPRPCRAGVEVGLVRGVEVDTTTSQFTNQL